MGKKSAARQAWRRARVQSDPRCTYCGITCSETVHERHPQRATVDDIVPLSRGGLNNASNWTLACQTCNRDKADNLITPSQKKAKRLASKPKRGRCSRKKPLSQQRIDEALAADRKRKDQAASLGFTLYPPIPGVQDEAFR